MQRSLQDKFQGQGILFYESAQKMWDSMGISALPEEDLQRTYLKPNVRVWAPQKLSRLQIAFYSASGPTPLIAVSLGRNSDWQYSDVYVYIRSQNHLLDVKAEKESARNGDYFMPSEASVTSYAGRFAKKIITISNNGLRTLALNNMIGTVHDILNEIDVVRDEDAGQKIDSACLSLKTLIR